LEWSIKLLNKKRTHNSEKARAPLLFGVYAFVIISKILPQGIKTIAKHTISDEI
jgi:hypothetical protein